MAATYYLYNGLFFLGANFLNGEPLALAETFLI